LRKDNLKQGFRNPRRSALGGTFEPDFGQKNLNPSFLPQLRRRQLLMLGVPCAGKTSLCGGPDIQSIRPQTSGAAETSSSEIWWSFGGSLNSQMHPCYVVPDPFV